MNTRVEPTAEANKPDPSRELDARQRASLRSKVRTVAGSHFHSAGWVDKKQSLFSVTSGVDIADALTEASDLVDAAMEPIYDAAMAEKPLQDNYAWLVFRALESAKAVIESVQVAAMEADRVAAEDAQVTSQKRDAQ